MLSFIFIRPTVWPQYTNVTDRTDSTQRSDSIGQTILQTVAQNRFAVCYRTVVLSCLSVCLSVLSVTLAYCGQTVGRIKMKFKIVLDGAQLAPSKRGMAPNFWPMSTVAKRSPISDTAEFLYKRSPKNSRQSYTKDS